MKKLNMSSIKSDVNRIKELSSHAKEKLSQVNVPRVGVLDEFKLFLDEYKITGLAIAFIIGSAASTFVKSLVDNIIMPLVTPFIPGGGWETAKAIIGPFVIGWGPFLAAAINFLIIAVVVFLISKWLLREEKVTKK